MYKFSRFYMESALQANSNHECFPFSLHIYRHLQALYMILNQTTQERAKQSKNCLQRPYLTEV